MERRDSGVKMYLRLFSVYGLAELATMTLFAPLERFKLLQQTKPLMKGPSPYTSVLNYLGTCWKTEGLTAYWRGNFASAFRVVGSSVIRFRFHYFFLWKFFKDNDNSYPLLRTVGHESSLGLLMLLLIYPLDQVRTRLALEVVPRGKDKNYFSLADCLGKSIKSDGIKGCYQGFLLTAASLPAYIALSSVASDLTKADLPRGYEFLHGMGVLALLQTLFYPVDTIRRRLQANGARGKLRLYGGTWDCIKQTMLTEGMAGYYRGLGIHLGRLLPSFYLFHKLTHLG